MKHSFLVGLMCFFLYEVTSLRADDLSRAMFMSENDLKFIHSLKGVGATCDGDLNDKLYYPNLSYKYGENFSSLITELEQSYRDPRQAAHLINIGRCFIEGVCGLPQDIQRGINILQHYVRNNGKCPKSEAVLKTFQTKINQDFFSSSNCTPGEWLRSEMLAIEQRDKATSGLGFVFGYGFGSIPFSLIPQPMLSSRLPAFGTPNS